MAWKMANYFDEECEYFDGKTQQEATQEIRSVRRGYSRPAAKVRQHSCRTFCTPAQSRRLFVLLSAWPRNIQQHSAKEPADLETAPEEAVSIGRRRSMLIRVESRPRHVISKAIGRRIFRSEMHYCGRILLSFCWYWKNLEFTVTSSFSDANGRKLNYPQECLSRRKS